MARTPTRRYRRCEADADDYTRRETEYSGKL